MPSDVTSMADTPPADRRWQAAYVAGPMRGYPLSNFPAFDNAAQRLRLEGWGTVYSPATHDRELGFDETVENPSYEEGIDLQKVMRWDIEAVLKSNAIYLLKGWEDSKGAKIEKSVAEAVGIEILYEAPPVADETPAQEAYRLVHGARQQSYGHPADDFTKQGVMWGAIIGEHHGHDPIPPEKIGLCMIATKIARELNRHKRDNLVDMSGYAETLHLIHERNG